LITSFANFARAYSESLNQPFFSVFTFNCQSFSHLSCLKFSIYQSDVYAVSKVSQDKHQIYVLKACRYDSDSSTLYRLEREAEIVSLLNESGSRNMIEYVDSGTVSFFYPQGFLYRPFGKPILKMESSEFHLYQMLADISLCLKDIHKNGFLQMDVKPSNIIYYQGVYLMIDFDGAIKINASKVEIQNNLWYTHLFASPWIIDNYRPCIEDDFFSLCATAYFLIYEELPWSEIDENEQESANLRYSFLKELNDSKPNWYTKSNLDQALQTIGQNRRKLRFKNFI
jgi:serine/threonine protein kinase